MNSHIYMSSRRYTTKWEDVLLRRTRVSESWLEHLVHQLDSNQLMKDVTSSAQERALREIRKTAEEQQLRATTSSSMTSSSSSSSTFAGRVSGSKEWKSSRSEIGKVKDVDEPQKSGFHWDEYGSHEQIQATMTRYDC